MTPTVTPGSPVFYVTPNGRKRLAQMIESRDDGAAMAVFRQAPDDFSLPANAKAPNVVAGYDGAVTVVDFALYDNTGKPLTWHLTTDVLPVPPAEPATIESTPATVSPAPQ